MAKVELKNLIKTYNNKIKALEDINLTIEDGQFFVLLGPSGAGKTTTLRCIAGLEKIDSGDVLFNDENITHDQPASRDVTFVFQQYSLYPHYTVYENLAFPLRSPMRKLPEEEIKNKVEKIAEMLKITNKLKNKATQLSGGEMQRVAIGRALVREPNIYLMDEPLSSLDAKLRETLRVELKNIQLNLNATILYVTHDQAEATTLADKIGVLKEGKIVQIGTPEEIYENPNSISFSILIILHLKYGAKDLGLILKYLPGDKSKCSNEYLCTYLSVSKIGSALWIPKNQILYISKDVSIFHIISLVVDK